MALVNGLLFNNLHKVIGQIRYCVWTVPTLRFARMSEKEVMLDENVSAVELKARLDKGDKLVLLDVREPWEFRIAKIEGAILIPLREVGNRVNELDPETETVVLCHHGIRSKMALDYLREKGFQNLKNLAGGMNAWSLQVDPKVPFYQ